MTTTATKTLRKALNDANPNEISDALRKVRLGQVLAPVKVAFAALTAAATIDITTVAAKAAATITPTGLLETGEELPPIGVVKTLRVTTSGTANSVGSYVVSDAGGTAVSPTAGANVGIALLSDDGKSLTFPTTVTGFVIEYMPRGEADLEASFSW